MQHISTVIIDDEQLVINNLKYLLNQFPEVQIICETTDPYEALEVIKMTPEIDLVILDISMPILDGMETAKQIYRLNPWIKTIFLTAYEEYVMDAFQVNTIDYILKPITMRRLQRTMHKLNEILTREKQMVQKKQELIKEKAEEKITKFVGLKNNQFFVIDIKDGYYLMVQEREIILFTKEDTYLLKHNMNYWEEQLKLQGWFRCHRAYLVNINHIKTFTPMFNSTYSIRIENHKEEIPVSRSYILPFKNLLGI